jgi:Mlc titration factor MtfA (ptsG expression regulator)
MFGFKQSRRRRLREKPLPESWRSILEHKVGYFQCLTADEQAELCGHIQVFLAEKRFEGCGGLEVTDEIRVTIAALACVLLLHRDTDYFPLMRSVLVYPQHFFTELTTESDDGIVCEEIADREGESWHRGPVVLSWEDVEHDAAAPDDGVNVVFHEFAHQLDSESGAEDGAPLLPERSMVGDWARILGREYERLIDDVENRRPHLIDEYGASDPAEFFAVVSELFFEMPAALARHHPEIYELMRRFYRQDPAARLKACRPPERR